MIQTLLQLLTLPGGNAGVLPGTKSLQVLCSLQSAARDTHLLLEQPRVLCCFMLFMDSLFSADYWNSLFIFVNFD